MRHDYTVPERPRPAPCPYGWGGEYTSTVRCAWCGREEALTTRPGSQATIMLINAHFAKDAIRWENPCEETLRQLAALLSDDCPGEMKP